ncbi:DMT family transporter [Alteromonas oceanisediminis]|uniref:DMT family transporter n=1 Tax=Alteromonas oceanisediminis TaxID=2836180 RepID=UPI001BD925EA|nr:DMT family transporter [Alteromonas oceanisediminis]MBT0586282.1 DMT family transporter [Alteromonas oceanisediminis]
MSSSAVIKLFILGAIWGSSFLFMRAATPEFGVYPLVELRTVLASLFLLPFVLLRRQWRDMVVHWRHIAVIGVVNTAVPFALFNYSSLHLEAGYNSILNATAPMFGALIAFIWLSDRLERSAIFGLLIGFFGVVQLSWAKVSGSGISFLPIATALMATCCYGIAASYMKRYMQGVKPLAIAAGSQLFASVFLLPAALWTWPVHMPGNSAWFQAIALAVVCTGVAYILYFDLIATEGPSKAITVAYLVPLFGVIWGGIFLHERLSVPVYIGGACILIGVALTNGLVGKQRAKRRP